MSSFSCVRSRASGTSASGPRAAADGSKVGWGAMSPGLLDDVHRSWLQPIDLAVATAFVLTLQTHPSRERDVHFEDDSVVVSIRGASRLRDWDASASEGYQRVLSSRVGPALERVAARGWLIVEKVPPSSIRVQFGPRFTGG
jgi:hypothetical protein